jgi:hypothetical protein
LEQAEQAIEELVIALAKIEEGDLQQVEQEVFRSMTGLRRACLERVGDQQASKAASPARRVGGCGQHQRLVSQRQRQLLTLLGPICIQRAYYQCLLSEEQAGQEQERRCSHGEAPFDQQWGLSSQRSSAGMQRLISYLSATLTQHEVAQAISQLLPCTISARQVLNVTQPVGEAFLRREDEQVQQFLAEGTSSHTSEAEQRAARAEPINRLYVEIDGVMARLRRGSVPMEKQEQERQGDVYREVKVGAVFIAEPGRQRSELVPAVFVDTAGPIRYVARRTTAEDFGPRLWTLAQRVGLQRAKQVIILADGAKWIWNLAEEQFPGAVQIVDEYHARQHVWEVARAAFATDVGSREMWARAVIEKLSEGEIEEVIAAIEALPPLAPEPGKARSLLEIEADSFRSNRQRMRYPLYRAQGMHLGSGIAEAACKTVVSTRAKRAGMRWTPDGLDALLALRTSVLNQEFDRDWHALKEVA